MRTVYTLRVTALTLFLLFCLSPSWANKAAVLKVDGKTVVLNRGRADKVERGQTYELLHRGQPAGRVVVQSVDEYSATAVRLDQSGRVEVGDLASPVAGQVAAAPAPSNNKQSTGLSVDLRTAERAYRSALDRRTESRKFKTPNNVNQSIQMMNLLTAGLQFYSYANVINVAGANNFDTSYILPSVINSGIGMASDTYFNQQMMAGQRVKVRVEVTYWDEALASRYAYYLAARDGLDEREATLKKFEIIQEKMIDKYAVFEVEVTNVGDLPAPLAPINQRMYLLNGDKKAVLASRYTRSLDATVQPKGGIRGTVYFPKITVAQRKNFDLLFLNMFGDHGEMGISLD